MFRLSDIQQEEKRWCSFRFPSERIPSARRITIEQGA